MSRLNKGAAEQRFPLPLMLQKLACALAVALALVCAGACVPTTAQAQTALQAADVLCG